MLDVLRNTAGASPSTISLSKVMGPISDMHIQTPRSCASERMLVHYIPPYLLLDVEEKRVGSMKPAAPQLTQGVGILGPARFRRRMAEFLIKAVWIVHVTTASQFSS